MPSFHVTFALLFGQWNQVEETSLDSYYEGDAHLAYRFIG